MRQSEVVYIGDPTLADADFSIRIFFLKGAELGFVGTPLICAVYEWLRRRNRPKKPGQVVVEQNGQRIVVRLSEHGLGYVCPRPDKDDELDDAAIAPIAAMLGIDKGEIRSAQYQRLEPSPRIAVQLADRDAVKALAEKNPPVTFSICLWAWREDGAESNVEQAILFPGSFDPVCGMSPGWAGYSFAAKGLLTKPMIISQGCAWGREAFVRISLEDNGDILVVGKCVTTISGRVDFEIQPPASNEQ
jgi:predicted PhzF superfamily epimerase YddE/YHI9